MAPVPVNYDFGKAAAIVAAVAARRSNVEGHHVLGVYKKDCDLHDVMDVASNGNNLKFATDLANEGAEMQYEVTGVLWAKDLPPPSTVRINYGSRPDSTTLRFMKQSVTLVAMQSHVFEEGAKELERLRNFFARTVGVNVAIFNAAKTLHGSTMDIATRMFTSSKDAPEEEHISLSADIDPDGVLRLLLESEPGFVHCMDNHVDYLRVASESSSGKPIYMPCRPARFREGDIVTCTFALALVPRKGRGNGYTMIKVLRQLALEHEMPTQDGVASDHFNGSPPRPSLKRPRKVVDLRRAHGGYIDVAYAKKQIAVMKPGGAPRGSRFKPIVVKSIGQDLTSNARLQKAIDDRETLIMDSQRKIKALKDDKKSIRRAERDRDRAITNERRAREEVKRLLTANKDLSTKNRELQVKNAKLKDVLKGIEETARVAHAAKEA
ncbi:uncharacterized protein SCHCODRAFT_02667912 [Schizophyllum commune H4-8]|uniref:uncharacterized protein n=1 Tax=Schizophyllum commune (strain H4-8 / FGSC 9210) TaxID=578458 RepID=UPI00215F36D1|nr:uncharacterized protein SCHCODRAFT_02667912 [Schizophyllum commune H4-8]KAI5892453.1 hypothetical protein SCHCODRAFT_02667912 [Schizophyllum commune H4-8]